MSGYNIDNLLFKYDNQCEVFDLASKAFKPIEDCVLKIQLYGAIVFGEYIMTAGGEEGVESQRKELLKYNPTKNSWSKFKSQLN